MAESTTWKQNWHMLVAALLVGGMGGGFTVDKLLAGNQAPQLPSVSPELLEAKLQPLTTAINDFKATFRLDFAEERASRERLFADLSSRVTGLDNRMRAVELELAERRGKAQ